MPPVSLLDTWLCPQACRDHPWSLPAGSPWLRSHPEPAFGHGEGRWGGGFSPRGVSLSGWDTAGTRMGHVGQLPGCPACPLSPCSIWGSLRPPSW